MGEVRMILHGYKRSSDVTGSEKNVYRRCLMLGSAAVICAMLACRNFDSLSVEVSARAESVDVASDAPGEFGGRWNLWEYIGDSMAALIGE